MVNLSQEESGQNGRVRIGAPTSSALRAGVVNPGVGWTPVNPEGEATTLCQSFVIVSPVADAVSSLMVIVGHASRLSEALRLRLFMQQGQRDT